MWTKTQTGLKLQKTTIGSVCELEWCSELLTKYLISWLQLKCFSWPNSLRYLFKNSPTAPFVCLCYTSWRMLFPDVCYHMSSRQTTPYLFPLLLTHLKSARQLIWFRAVLNLQWEHLVISCWSWKDLTQTESLTGNRARMQLVIAHALVSGNKTNLIDVDISKLATWWFDSLCSLSVFCHFLTFSAFSFLTM